MKLSVSIRAGKDTRDITIQVGHGTQTFKWLANAAAFRFVHVVNRHKTLSTLPLSTELLPKNVYTEDCPFLHPLDIINDHLSDKQKVIIELYTSLELDCYGSPVLSPWAFIAFRHGERHEEEIHRLVEEKKREVEAFSIKKTHDELIAKTESEKPKIAMMREVMKHQLLSDEEVANIFNGEWGIVKDSGILDTIMPKKEEQEDIKRFLGNRFFEICAMYKYYSSVNSGGMTHTLEYIELCKFITETGILSDEHSNNVLRIFIDSHLKNTVGNRGVPSIRTEIARHEFLVAIVKIAVYKYITLPKKEVKRN